MGEFDKAGIVPEEYLNTRDLEKPLPWDFIDTVVSKEFLIREWRRALSGESTSDCRLGECSGCGVCDFREFQPVLASVGPQKESQSAAADPEPAVPTIRRLRLQYAKRGKMRFLGHQDLIRVFHRGLRRAGIRLDYSKGFHPHPKLRFSPPLALGVESLAEYLDFDMIDSCSTVGQIRQLLLDNLPAGIEPLDLAEISLSDPAVSGRIQSVTYEIEYSGSDPELSPIARAHEFRSASSFELESSRKGKVRRLDLKEWVLDLAVSERGLSVTLRSGPEGSVHPLDAAAAILGLTRDEAKMLKILKSSVCFDTSYGE
jgi:radical SAM-linked protein